MDMPAVELEFRNDDPHACDDCWHRGPYWIARCVQYWIRVEAERAHGARDLLEVQLRAKGCTATHYIETVKGREAEGEKYRLIYA